MFQLLGLIFGTILALCSSAAMAERPTPETVLGVWYQLSLDLVRHTPTYTPPVASRFFAYVGVAAYEATASGRDDLVSMAGQLNELRATPARAQGQYDEALVLQETMAGVVGDLFSNTGPTGQRALGAVRDKLGAQLRDGLAPDVIARSEDYGHELARFILAWAATDGGAVIDNMGFPREYPVATKPENWVPTSKIVLQQAPLLPLWGQNRPFAMPAGAVCNLAQPVPYSEDPGSDFYAQAIEVYETVNTLSDDQKAIARFWSDDAMLSVTPPGHWISIAMQSLDHDQADIARRVEVLAKLGVAVADGFIGCWNAKYEYDLLRPITYIRKLIDPKWEPLLLTPPFPEYPSGHSTQSGAAAAVLSALFGEAYSFEDHTGENDGQKPRQFTSFWQAAQEAGISRLYGGIHFRPAVELGLDQGRCIGAYAAALKTRK